MNMPDAPWIGLDEEEYNEQCNPYYDWEKNVKNRYGL